MGKQGKHLGNTKLSLGTALSTLHLKDAGMAKKLRAQDRGEHPSVLGTPGRKATYLGEDKARGCSSETKVE